MRLDIGCGSSKKEGFTGIDIFDWSYQRWPSVTVHPDQAGFGRARAFPYQEEVYARHFIEHIPQYQVIETFNEIYRILIPEGLFEIFVPPTTGRGAFCDPTHSSFWNDLSFRYFDMTWDKGLSESYGIKCNFKILENKIINEFNLHAMLKAVKS